jgi:hypothetical protein
MAPAVARTREQLTEDLLDLDSCFSAFLRTYSSEQLTRRPANGGWSATECVEHVARVNTQYIPAIKAAIAAEPAALASRDQPLTTAGWFSVFFLKSVSPQGRVKLRSPRVTHAASPVAPEEAVRRLLGTHQEIREILASSRADLNRLRFKNPFVPLLRFTVATGILIMAAHGRRHLLQAERACTPQDSQIAVR